MDDHAFLSYRKVFFGWANKNWTGMSDSIIEETFFDAMAVYLDYDMKGKVNVKPTTFLISVGHRMFQQLRKKETLELKKELPIEIDNSQEQKEWLRAALKKLGEKCQEMLVSKYFHKLSAEEIMEETGAKSRAVVRTQLKRCRQQLKSIMNDLMN